MSRPTAHFDLETRSRADLRKTGVYKYAEDPSTDVILACWCIGDGPIHTWRRDDHLPAELREVLREGRIVAHNVSFERTLLRNVLGPRYGWPEPALEQYDCTMARARAAGLPGALANALDAMGAPFGKDREGQSLMLRMCRPRRVENDGTVIWWEDEERIARLAAYCAADVQGERWLDKRIPQLIQQERQVWLADQRLNDRGVPIDVDFCRDAIAVSEEARVALDREIRSVTGGFVPKASNVGKLRTWLLQQGVQIAETAPEGDEDDGEELDEKEPELRRNDVERLLAGSLPDHARRALEIRLEAGKSSVKKVNAMLARVQADGRVRGMLSYYGAATGRWSAAGSGIQLQNLPRDTVKNWDGARASVAVGASAVEVIEGPPLAVLSKMLRGTIKAPDGRQLIYADLSSVEARGVAWLAGQHDLVRDFASGAKMYESMAADVFDMTVEEVIALGKDCFERFVGKGLVLGAGYGMGAPKFAATCAKQGREVSDELAERGIRTFRTRFPRIPALWYGLEEAAIAAVKDPSASHPAAGGKVTFGMFKRWLVMNLPTGSRIFYRNPRIVWDDRFGKEALAYDGTDSKTKRWGEQRTYGGRLTENAVQRICRDIIAFRLPDLERQGYEPILLVHDETITETDAGTGSREELVELMCRLPSGLAGFPLAAEGAKPGSRYAK